MDPYVGEIKMMSFAFAPKGWAQCNGQLLPINQNQALFSLLGTMYGGDGRTTFALPDFRSRTPLHMGTGFVQGQRAGEENHTLNITEMPTHGHTPMADGSAAGSGTPVGGTWAAQEANPYSTSINTTMLPSATGGAGGSQPHPNLSPYLTINFCIALVGVFPSRD